MVSVSIIAAMARNRAIGLRGEIPWYIPDDLKRFKALTLGHPCIMGRKTFESIVARLGKPLPGRDTIVVSSSGFLYPGVMVCSDVDQAMQNAKELAVKNGTNQIFVCGGAQIYAAMMPCADRLYITEVDMEPEADAFMPNWDGSVFREVFREDQPALPPYRFLEYVRR